MTAQTCLSCDSAVRSSGLCQRHHDREMYLRRRAALLADPEKLAAARAKQRARVVRWHAQQTYEERFARRIQAKYGLSIGRYMEMYQRQGGACAICRTPYAAVIKAKQRRLYVDHDHATGRPRGLLCHSCNTAIGHLRDDPKLLASAIAYLNG